MKLKEENQIQRLKTLLNINEELPYLNLILMDLLLSPEKSIQIQRDLGADFVVVYECTLM